MSENLEQVVMNHSFDPLADEILFAGQSQTNSLHAMGPLIHSYYLVHYVISGKGTMTVRGHTYQLERGDSFFIFPDEYVRYEADELEPWRYCWIGFKGSRFKALLQGIYITPLEPVVRQIIDDMLQDYTLIREELMKGSISGRLRANSYLQKIIARYSEQREQQQLIRTPKSPAQQAMDEIVAYIDYNYPQPITIAELANRIGYHRSHLSKLFKSSFGIAPVAYLMKVRLEQAQLLLTQQIPVHQVAQAVGFHDPLYFSKQFKRHFGISPSQYQASSYQSQ